MKPERIQRVGEPKRSLFAKVWHWIKVVAGALKRLFGPQNDSN